MERFCSMTRWHSMARQNRLRRATKAVASTAKRLVPTSKEAKTVAGVALGAAAIAAAGVAAKKVGDAVREGNAALNLQRMAARKPSLSSLRKRRKRPSTKSSKRTSKRAAGR